MCLVISLLPLYPSPGWYQCWSWKRSDCLAPHSWRDSMLYISELDSTQSVRCRGVTACYLYWYMTGSAYSMYSKSAPPPPPNSCNSTRGNVWPWFIRWFHSSLIFCQHECWGVRHWSGTLGEECGVWVNVSVGLFWRRQGLQKACLDLQAV